MWVLFWPQVNEMSEVVSLKMCVQFVTSLNMGEKLPQKLYIITCRNAISRHILHKIQYTYSQGHTLRYYTPAMVCSKVAAMPQNCVRCCVRKFNMLNILVPILGYFSYLLSDFQTVFQHCDGDPISCHVIWDPTFSGK